MTDCMFMDSKTKKNKTWYQLRAGSFRIGVWKSSANFECNRLFLRCVFFGDEMAAAKIYTHNLRIREVFRV